MEENPVNCEPTNTVYSIILYDSELDQWIVRIRADGDVEFNRTAHPEWLPEEFAKVFTDVLYKTILAADKRVEDSMESRERQIVEIKRKLGYKNVRIKDTEEDHKLFSW